ncbi:hypothetical protein [Planococcus chinensis]|uniref:Uncharacterized protein n=1 Tax=Planococcus chinensis TaxID=272917 RepID=A0ABW4QEH6_9BACL
MAFRNEESEPATDTVLKHIQLDPAYHIKKKVMETMLYSVYIITAIEKGAFSDKVLLVRHPPAAAPTSCVLPVELEESETMTESIQKITAALLDDPAF